MTSEKIGFTLFFLSESAKTKKGVCGGHHHYHMVCLNYTYFLFPITENHDIICLNYITKKKKGNFSINYNSGAVTPGLPQKSERMVRETRTHFLFLSETRLYIR